MTSFALLAEGETDQVVLEEIIQTIYQEQIDEEVVVRYAQPVYDETSRSRHENFGGWEMLLNFCESKERILQALTANDYIVIQIDTDICEHERIGISKNKKTTTQLIYEMKEFIKSRIPPEVYQNHNERIIFAIAVHSTECWLLPLHAVRDGDKNQVLNCEDRLRRALGAKRIKYVKEPRDYLVFARGFRRYRTLNEAKAHSESLCDFINSLPDLTDFAREADA